MEQIKLWNSERNKLTFCYILLFVMILIEFYPISISININSIRINIIIIDYYCYISFIN